jgi:heme-degrading monooxygenase HmoA
MSNLMAGFVNRGPFFYNKGEKGMNQPNILEVVLFKTVKGTDEGAFLEAADAMMPELRLLRGFTRRELLRDKDGQWMDVVSWKSLQEAEEAMKKVMSHPACLKFFKMIDESSIKMMHFVQKRAFH